MPDQDPTWPQCTVQACGNKRELDPFVPSPGWCNHIQQTLYDGKDGEKLDFGMRICVPIQPHLGFYAEVSIDSESISGIMAKLALVRESVVKDPFGMDNEELISLGMWTAGEGRFIIALAIGNWIEGQPAIDKCIWHAHSFQQEMKLQHADAQHPMFQKANNWCLAYYGMCYPCYEADQQKQSAAIVPDFTGGAFGMGEVDPPRGRASAGVTPRQGRTQQLLQQRYGNSTLANPPLTTSNSSIVMIQSNGQAIDLVTTAPANSASPRPGERRRLAGWDGNGVAYYVNQNGTVSQ